MRLHRRDAVDLLQNSDEAQECDGNKEISPAQLRYRGLLSEYTTN